MGVVPLLQTSRRLTSTYVVFPCFISLFPINVFYKKFCQFSMFLFIDFSDIITHTVVTAYIV